MNEHDSERIVAQLEDQGMVATTSVEDADVVVLNTCCIRENADNKLYGTLGHLKSQKAVRPDLKIMVGGCLAQKDRDEIQRRAGHVDVVFGTHNVHRAAELLEASARGPVLEILEAAVDDDDDRFPTALRSKRELGYASWVTIQIGCDNNCAFCIVPSVRGAEASRPFDDLVNEVELLAADGVTEITLLGQNVNSYGRDLAAKQYHPLFAELLRAVGAVDGIRRVRFTSPHPKDFREDTIAAMAETPAVCEHLHLPLQSGSDRVLAAMHRGYTGERYLSRITAARAAMPDLALTTDLIVGFPGESDADFDDTLTLVAEVGFDAAFTFIYSPRPGTEAAELTHAFVPHEVSVARMERLRAVLDRSSLQIMQNEIGKTVEAVIEGPSKRDATKLTARTRQNRLVHFNTDHVIRPGSYAQFEITAAAQSSLSGRLLDVTVPATHRTRIPVSIA
jgi:tRNA-2-methylthio-N6-dimethylallyladenosine synthase